MHEKPSIVSQVLLCGQMDGHDEANVHLSQFCKRAYKLLQKVVFRKCFLKLLSGTALITDQNSP